MIFQKIYGIIKWDFLIKIGRFAAHNPIDKSYNLWYNKRGNINIRGKKRLEQGGISSSQREKEFVVKRIDSSPTEL